MRGLILGRCERGSCSPQQQVANPDGTDWLPLFPHIASDRDASPHDGSTVPWRFDFAHRPAWRRRFPPGRLPSPPRTAGGIRRPSKHAGPARHQTAAPGADPNDQSTFDEATANPYKDSMPDVLTIKDGTKVTSPDQWPARRAEIVEDVRARGLRPDSRERPQGDVGGHRHAREGESGGIPTVTKTLVGHVDNSAFPQIKVDIQASFTVPKRDAAGADHPAVRLRRPVRAAAVRNAAPARAGPSRPSPTAGATARSTPTASSRTTTGFRAGIIGLTNKGEPRKPDDWGALRAWAWGVSRLIDYFEATPRF